MSLLSTGNGHFLPRLVINLLDLLCICIYLLDIALRLVVNNGKNRVKRLPFYKDKWLLIRLVCAAVLFLDCIIFLSTHQPLRFARALIPMIYIARRNSMRQMVHGLVNAFLKSTSILSFLFLVHFLWSYLGFVLFRGVPVEGDNRFVDFPTTLLTVLQCATSRSYSLFALVPYYEVNPTASLFFLALTIAADLICINLIVAVGNRQYRLFSTLLFKRQLRNRRQAFVAIHALLSDDKGFVSRDTWIGFCSNIQGKYSVTREAADLLFSLEGESNCDRVGFDCVDCVGFFRLSALLSARIDLDVDKVTTNQTEPARIGGEGEERGDTVHSNPLHTESLTPILTRDTPPPPAAPAAAVGEMQGAVAGDVAYRVERSLSEPSVIAVETPLHTSDQQQGNQPRANSTDTIYRPERVSLHPAVDKRVAEKKRTRLEFRSRADTALLSDTNDTDIHNIDEMELLTASTNSQNSPWMKLLYSLRLKTVQMIKYTIPLSHLVPSWWPVASDSSMVFSPYDSFFFLVKVVLAIQLVFLSRRQNTLAWIRLGWVIEALLWMEMLLLMFAWGIAVYFRRGGFGYITSLNVITLIVMILMGSNADETFSSSYFLLLIFQSCRYLVFFRYLADAALFLTLVPLLLRVLFIIFCVIYAFAVLGHNRLCNVFNADNIDDATDDDASNWLNFEQMFNFSSLLQTMYTLFYVMMLGNWTWIMDAAARTERVPSLLFFYSFRLLMTLVVIPIMFAFIIQSYIAKRDKDEKSKGTDEIRLSDHCRIAGTYQFEAPTPSAVGEEPISEGTLDRALQRAESKRSVGTSVSEADRSVTSYQMEATDSSSSSSKIRSEKDVIRRWNQGTLSVQSMFEAYAMGLFFADDHSDSNSFSSERNHSQHQSSDSSVSWSSPPSLSRSTSDGRGRESSDTTHRTPPSAGNYQVRASEDH